MEFDECAAFRSEIDVKPFKKLTKQHPSSLKIKPKFISGLDEKKFWVRLILQQYPATSSQIQSLKNHFNSSLIQVHDRFWIEMIPGKFPTPADVMKLNFIYSLQPILPDYSRYPQFLLDPDIRWVGTFIYAISPSLKEDSLYLLGVLEGLGAKKISFLEGEGLISISSGKGGFKPSLISVLKNSSWIYSLISHV